MANWERRDALRLAGALANLLQSRSQLSAADTERLQRCQLKAQALSKSVRTSAVGLQALHAEVCACCRQASLALCDHAHTFSVQCPLLRRYGDPAEAAAPPNAGDVPAG